METGAPPPAPHRVTFIVNRMFPAGPDRLSRMESGQVQELLDDPDALIDGAA